MTTITAGQIQAQISAIRKRTKNGAHVFAIRAPEGWAGPAQLQIDGIDHLVMSCVSDLQAREALLRANEEHKPAVLLCSVSADKLGEDVIARLAKRRVFAPQPVDILSELFSARIIDPRVLSTRSLVDALLDHVPAAGYKPVAGGALDLQQAWEALMEQMLGVSIDGPSVSQVLEWSADAKRIKVLADLPPQLKQDFVDWFARSRGETIRFLMAAIDTGAGTDLIPLGLLLGLIFSPEFQKHDAYRAARVRMENYFGGKDIDPESAQEWFRSAESIVRPLLEEQNDQALRAWVKRVDALIADVKIPEFAYLSNYSAAGLNGRFDRLGTSLSRALKTRTASDMDDVRGCLGHISQHVLAPIESDRLDRGEMAFRLIGWLRSTALPSASASFPDLVEFYHQDGGFLDWARNRLRETDVSALLQAAFLQIIEQVDGPLAKLEKAFAGKLIEWTKGEHQSNRLICIEDVLTKVVVPSAKVQPVLLLVLDGMSTAVFRQLLRDVERLDWTKVAHDSLGVPRPVLATLPSITQISRRSLFLGKLDPGKAGTEKGEFSGNDFLFQASGSQVRPKLFLKGDLQEEGHGGLATEVRQALADKKCRVVGVVVNAIDDHLDSGDQVVFTWSMDRIKPLRELFKLAADSGRLILMTSDHGHVLDFGTRQFSTHGGASGDRYRMDTSALKDGEMVFEGSRVQKAMGQNKIALAWCGDVRYGSKKRGYHGGANPQEMVVPFAILSWSDRTSADGWNEVPPYEPEWWRITGVDAPITVPVSEVERPKKKPAKDDKAMDLFEHVEAKKADAKKPDASHAWIEALLDSGVYQEQLKLAVRGAPQRSLMFAFLQTITARGGSIMKPALAQVLAVPLFRVDGFVQNVSRILNVDGYEVLSFDRGTETITVNLKLLKTQFEIK